jgi:hypothetical protein
MPEDEGQLIPNLAGRGLAFIGRDTHWLILGFGPLVNGKPELLLHAAGEWRLFHAKDLVLTQASISEDAPTVFEDGIQAWSLPEGEAALGGGCSFHPDLPLREVRHWSDGDLALLFDGGRELFVDVDPGEAGETWRFLKAGLQVHFADGKLHGDLNAL